MAKIVLIKIWNSGLEIRESIWWIKVICCYFFNIYICVIKKEISYQEYSTCNIKEFIIFPFRNVERLVMNSSQYHISKIIFRLSMKSIKSLWSWFDQCLITRIKRLYQFIPFYTNLFNFYPFYFSMPGWCPIRVPDVPSYLGQ